MAAGKPKWKEADAIKRGKAAHELAVKYREEIEPRLAGLEEVSIDGLGTDLVTLGGSGVDRSVTTTEKKGQTAEEREQAAKGKKWVMEIRAMARKTRGIKKSETKSLGVGEEVSEASTSSVVTALTNVFKAFTKYPELAAHLGVVEADLTEGRLHLSNLPAADQEQAAVISTGKEKTFNRNQVQLRVEEAVDAISVRGKRAFSDDPAVYDLFEELTSMLGTQTTPADSGSGDAAAPPEDPPTDD